VKAADILEAAKPYRSVTRWRSVPAPGVAARFAVDTPYATGDYSVWIRAAASGEYAWSVRTRFGMLVNEQELKATGAPSLQEAIIAAATFVAEHAAKQLSYDREGMRVAQAFAELWGTVHETDLPEYERANDPSWELPSRPIVDAEEWYFENKLAAFRLSAPAKAQEEADPRATRLEVERSLGEMPSLNDPAQFFKAVPKFVAAVHLFQKNRKWYVDVPSSAKKEDLSGYAKKLYEALKPVRQLDASTQDLHGWGLLVGHGGGYAAFEPGEFVRAKASAPGESLEDQKYKFWYWVNTEVRAELEALGFDFKEIKKVAGSAGKYKIVLVVKVGSRHTRANVVPFSTFEEGRKKFTDEIARVKVAKAEQDAEDADRRTKAGAVPVLKEGDIVVLKGSCVALPSHDFISAEGDVLAEVYKVRRHAGGGHHYLVAWVDPATKDSSEVGTAPSDFGAVWRLATDEEKVLFGELRAHSAGLFMPTMSTGETDEEATTRLRRAELKSKSDGSQNQSIITAGYAAKSDGKTYYVYPSNASGPWGGIALVWRVTDKISDVLNRALNASAHQDTGWAFSVAPDLTFRKHAIVWQE